MYAGVYSFALALHLPKIGARTPIQIQSIIYCDMPACQAHPALVKQVQSRSVSCRCLEPMWFVRDPTSLACDNIPNTFKSNPVPFHY